MEHFQTILDKNFVDFLMFWMFDVEPNIDFRNIVIIHIVDTYMMNEDVYHSHGSVI